MKKLFFILVLFFFWGHVWATPEDDFPASCRVTTNLNVRANPSKKAAKLGLLQKNDTIIVDSVTGTETDRWGVIHFREQCGYISMRYVEYIAQIESILESVGTFQSSKDIFIEVLLRIWGALRWVLGILVVLVVFAYLEYIIELALYAGFFAAVGAGVFTILGCKSSTGAIVGLVVAALVGIRLLIDRMDIHIGKVNLNGFFRGLFLCGYYIISFPIYWLNQLEHFLVEPWRYFFRRDWVADHTKPTLRVAFEVLTVLMYVVITPLRLLNAFIYNILIHCVTGIYDLFFEVLVPCDSKEGAGNTGRWILMFPWRLLKYPIYHGALTIVESVVWTVVDVFIPARTLYHGTDLAACESITSDPYRNKYLKNISEWSSGTFLASSSPNCSWAGRGVYFAINRKLASGYSSRAGSHRSDPVMIACRVSMGRVINYSLAPSRVYRQAGQGGNHDELNKFGDSHGYTTGEWFNNRNQWEYCLFDWQNRYNHPWRIRPIYILNFNTGRTQHIRGGVQHWLFDKAVLKDFGIIKI